MIALGRNLCDEGIRVVALVGDDEACRLILDQRSGLSDIGDLSGQENDAQLIAQGINGHMKFGRQAAPRAADLGQARTRAVGFVCWYNFDHRHSGIRYVSPAQRHAGDDHAILAARHVLYLNARELNPARWSGDTRNWAPIGAVTLNPERASS
jgi:hypothetical protein